MCISSQEIFSFKINDENHNKTNDKLLKSDELDNDLAKKDLSNSFWALFFIAFLSGFVTLLTPCVFPMIPMTVSFFTKQSKTKAKGISNAIIYGISIIIIYVALGVGVSAIFGAETLNNMATNVYFNIAFFFAFDNIWSFISWSF